MSKIVINKISVQNFAGVAQGEYVFDDSNNIVEGKSGSGKTTAYYAYLWSLGFTVPSWEPQIDGYRITKTKTEVEVELNVNGMIYKIGRVNHPKYKINKFTAEEEYNGTDFRYLFDGAEQDSKATYQKKIADLFGVDYFTLELLCNITLFNGDDAKRWNKDERRKFLFKLFDLENKIAELGNDPEFSLIKEDLDKGKDELGIKEILNTLKSNIDSEMKEIQTLIEDKQKELAEYNSIDFEELDNKEKELDKKLEELYLQQKEIAKNAICTEKEEELSKLYNELSKVKNAHDNQVRNFETKFYDYEGKIKSCELDISFCKQTITSLENNLEDLKIDKSDIENEMFNESSTICPTCKQTLPSEQIEKLKTNFEENKLKRLEKINLETENKVSELNSKKERLNLLNAEKDSLIAKFEEFKKIRPEELDTTELSNKISQLKEEIANIDKSDLENEIKTKINEIKNEHKLVLNELAKKQVLENIINKIEQLKNRTRELGEQDSERIAKKLALQKYTQKKVNLVNTKVNENFEGVRFNFFKWNSSSAEKEYIDVCTAVLEENGTEYDSLSSGQKVKADLFTNNSLRKILGVNIPQFVDDVVLSDLEKIKNNWQTIYLLTNNSTKPKGLTLIQDCYSIKDCDIKYKS